jgi:hypothetical protein
MSLSKRLPETASRWVRSNRNNVDIGIVIDFRWRKWIVRIAGIASNDKRPRGFANTGGRVKGEE